MNLTTKNKPTFFNMLPAGSLQARFAQGAFWSLIGTLISQSLGLVSSIVIARILGKVIFGEFGIVNSTLNTWVILAGLGLGLTATKYISEFRLIDPERAGRILAMSNVVMFFSAFVFSLLLLLFAPLIATRVLCASHLVTELQIGCLLLFFNTLNNIQTGALAGLEGFKTISTVNLAKGIISFPVLITVTYWWNLRGAILAVTFLGIIGWWLNHLALKKECLHNNIKITYQGIWSEIPILWRFSLPAVLSGLFVGPVLWIANTILVRQPGGYGEMGILNATNQWYTILMFLPTVLLQVALPLLSSLTSDNEKKQDFGKTLEMTHSLILTVVFPLGVLLMFFSDWIIKIYGGSFSGGTLVLIGWISNVMIAAIGAPVGSAIQAKGRMWLGFINNVTWGVGVILFVYYFAPLWGAKSIPFGSSLSYIFMTYWVFIYLRKDLTTELVLRVFLSLGLVVFLTLVCIAIPATYRSFLAIPASLFTLYLILFLLTAKKVRQKLFLLVSSLLKRIPKEACSHA